MDNLREYYDENYSLMDPQLGNTVIVDGVNLYEYNADLIDYSPIQIPITSSVMKKIGKHSFVIDQYNNGNNGITMRFYVGGTTKQQAQVNYNKVIRALQKDIVVVNINDTEFDYVGILESVTVQHTGVHNYYLLEVSMVAVKRLPPVISNIDDTDAASGVELENSGVVDTGLLIGIKSDLNDKEITVVLKDESGTTYYSMEITNADQVIYNVIDGLNGKVLGGSTAKGIFEDEYSEDFTGYTNNFKNTVMYDFPKLKVGISQLFVTGAVDEVIVKHYPVFLV